MSLSNSYKISLKLLFVAESIMEYHNRYHSNNRVTATAIYDTMHEMISRRKYLNLIVFLDDYIINRLTKLEGCVGLTSKIHIQFRARQRRLRTYLRQLDNIIMHF